MRGDVVGDCNEEAIISEHLLEGVDLSVNCDTFAEDIQMVRASDVLNGGILSSANDLDLQYFDGNRHHQCKEFKSVLGETWLVCAPCITSDSCTISASQSASFSSSSRRSGHRKLVAASGSIHRIMLRSSNSTSLGEFLTRVPQVVLRTQIQVCL